MYYFIKKKRLTKFISVILAFVMLCGTSVPVYAASAKTVTIRLKVKSGDDIANKFNKASDKARHNKSGKKYVIIVPKGTYKLGSQIRLYSNTTANFTGCTIVHKTTSSTMLRLGRKSSDWEKYNGGKGHPGYTGFKNIKIIGGTFDGNGLKKAIMRFGHSKNITISGTTFKNVKESHFVEFGACAGVVVKNCKFLDYKGDFSGHKNVEALQFDALISDHFSAYTPNADETPCKNVTVTNCEFKNLQRGLGTHTGVANSYFNNMKFTNNKFENITGYAIVTTNYAKSKISGNTIRNCGAGIMFRTSEMSHSNFYESKKHSSYRSKYYNLESVICQNDISLTNGYKVNYKNKAYGIQLFGEKLTKKVGNVPAGDFRCAGVQVNDNKITLNTTGFGIYVKGGMENNIYNNTVITNVTMKGVYAGTVGIRLKQSSYNIVKKNIVKNVTKKGYDKGMNGIAVLNSSSKNKIYTNRVYNVRNDGIHIEKSKNNKFAKNRISNSKNCGIGIYSAQNTVLIENVIDKSKKYGIYTSTDAAKSIYKDENNKITNSGTADRNWVKK